MTSRHSALARRSSPAVDPEELQRFVETFLYREDALLVDEITRMDAEKREVDALLESTRPLPFSARQRVSEGHPAHVSGAELVMVTGTLGCLHAYFFHGCHWDEGWTGFGNRIHRADFKRLARVGPPVELSSRETKRRIGPNRVVIRYAFEFRQEGELVYVGDQSAMFFRGITLE